MCTNMYSEALVGLLDGARIHTLVGLGRICPVQLAKLEQKSDTESQTTFEAPGWFVCCLESRPPAGQATEVQLGFSWSARYVCFLDSAQRLLLISGHHSSPSVPGLQLLLFYFVIGLLLLLIRYIMFYLYSQSCNIMLLFFCIESKLVG